MASVIKSPGIEGATFSLGTLPSAVPERTGAGYASSVSSSTTASGFQRSKENRVVDEAAQQLEESIRKRVEEAVSLQVKALQQKHQAEEEALFAAASERGYEEGIRRAAEDVAQKKAASDKQFKLLEEGITKAVGAAFADATELACEIAFEAVLKILGREIASGEAVAALTREIAIRAEANEDVILRVNPIDAELLKSPDSIPLRYRVEADESLTRGGCVIETSHGIVDARLETRLDAFMMALRGTPSEHPEALP